MVGKRDSSEAVGSAGGAGAGLGNIASLSQVDCCIGFQAWWKVYLSSFWGWGGGSFLSKRELLPQSWKRSRPFSSPALQYSRL